MRNTAIICILTTLVLLSCKKESEPLKNETGYLIGNWINAQYDDTLVIFERSDSIKKDDYGFTFKPDHTFIEHKNSGWCGTPPIEYADFNGTYLKNDSVITIRVGYWKGLADYKWKIISVDTNYLSIQKIAEVYH
jgi:hypothetical protein